MLRPLLLTAVLLLALAAPAGAHHERTARPIVFTDVEQRMFEVINEYRVDNGRRALRPSLHLQRNARWYARNLATYDIFSITHVDSLRRSPQKRYASFGYPDADEVAENTAAGWPDAERTLQQWIDSLSHWKTMMGRDWTVLGVAVGYNPRTASKWFWVSTFGSIDDSQTESTVELHHEVIAPSEPRVVISGCAGRGDRRRCPAAHAISVRPVGGRGRTSVQAQRRRGGRWRALRPGAGSVVLRRGDRIRVRGRAVSKVGEAVGAWTELRA